jgi:hypothetical protein
MNLLIPSLVELLARWLRLFVKKCFPSFLKRLVHGLVVQVGEVFRGSGKPRDNQQQNIIQLFFASSRRSPER